MSIEQIEDMYELSPLQHGLLFHTLSTPHSGMYVIHVRWELEGAFAFAAFSRAWQYVFERHAILRTAFYWEELSDVGKPLQVVFRHVPVPLQEHDWRNYTAEEQQERLEEFLQADRLQGFELTDPPLVRLVLFRMADERYHFLWSFHHLLLDGWSFPLLIKEVFSAYEAFCQETLPVSTPVRSYREYISWVQQQNQAEAEAFWRGLLADVEAPTPLTTTESPPAADTEPHTGKTAELNSTLSSAMTQRLQTFVRQHGLTLNTLLQGAWALLLSRYSRQNTVVFGATSTGRTMHLPGIESMIGLFINTLPVKVAVPAHKSLLPWLQELQAQQAEQRQFEYSSLTQIQKWSNIPSGIPLFESIFVFENYPVDTTLTNSGEGLWARRIRSMEQTNYPLVLVAVPGSELLFRLNYQRERFAPETITRMMGHLQTLLEEMVSHPTYALGAYSFLTHEELAQIKKQNALTTDYPRDQCVHTLVEAQVAQTPDAIAIVANDVHLTYAKVNQRAAQLAHILRQRGVGPEVCVATYAERSPELLIAFLAILKAGGVYVPLDTSYPSSRINFMLEDAQVALLLTQQELLSQIPAQQPVLCLDDAWSGNIAESTTDISPAMASTHLAYVIYTSGSTGVPKGVAIPHQAIIRLVCETNYVHLTTTDVVAQASTAAFDAATFEIWGALTHGARLVIFDKETILTPQVLTAELRQKEVNTLFLTTAVFNQIVQQVPAAFARLRYLLFGGEAVDVRWVREVLQHGKPEHFLHVYGPTESTTYASWFAIHEVAPAVPTLPIGSALANTELYVLDQHGQLAAPGTPGELCIGGAGLARAYLQRPALTAEKFVPHPFADAAKSGARLYRTGDLVRLLPDQQIEFLGRLDQQIKLRGFRIELGEIEQALLHAPGIQEAVVLLHTESLASKQLVAYLVTHEPPVTPEDLRDHLLAHLPEFMVPTFFVFLDTLPLTTNGKVDRQALRALPIQKARLTHETTEPGTLIEEALREIWQQVLGIENIAMHDNFFALGGDSILSIQIVARARQAGLSISPRQIFLAPTIADLAKLCASTAPPVAHMEQGPVVGQVVLTPIQAWFFEQARHNPHHFNQAMLLRPRQPLRFSLLEQALQALYLHHDALRMRFSLTPGGIWQQEIAAPDKKAIGLTPIVDLSAIHPQMQERQLELLATQAQGSLQLSSGPLLRALSFILNDSETRVLIVIHHLIIDSVSWRILLEDLQQAYQQLVNGQSIQLPQKTTSFLQWSHQLTEYAQSSAAKQELEYWTRFASYPPCPLPVETRMDENTGASTNFITVALSQTETQLLLHEASEAYHTQINDLLLTALALALVRWTGRAAVSLDLEGHGREEIVADVDLSRTVGWFTSLYPVYLQIEEAFSLSDTIKMVKEYLRALPYNGIGYGLLHYLSADEGVKACLQAIDAPEVSFNYLGQLDQMQAEHSLFTFATEPIGPTAYPQDVRPYLLSINCAIRNGCFQASWAHSLNRHSASTIQYVADTFIEVLRDVLAHCQQPESGGYTPSDFPLASLSQAQLDTALGTGRQIEALYPLSPLQQGLLFQEYYALHSGDYIVQAHYRLQGDIQVEAFKAAWKHVLHRHATLRTAFIWEGLAVPHQVVRRTIELPLLEQDWRNYSDVEQEQRLQAYLDADRQTGFVLHEAPLLRFLLVRTGAANYELTWSMHQIILDGWSLPLLLKEVALCYQAYCRQEIPQLEPVQPFQHYLAWLIQQDQENVKAFWLRELADFTAPTPLGIDTSASASKTGEYSRQEIHLSLPLTQALQQMAQQYHLTLNTLIQGAWAILLSRYSRQNDVTFGITVSGRPAELSGIETMVGVFINALPLHVRLAPEIPLNVWLQDLQTYLVELRQYEHSSLVDIQRWSKLPPNVPLFESMVVFENYPLRGTGWNMGTDLTIQGIQGFEQTHYPLTLFALPGKQLNLKLHYDTTRISAAAATRLLGHLQTLLEASTADPAQPLGRLPLLSSVERHQMLVEWNATRQSLPPTSLWELFSLQVARTPDAIAYVQAERQISFAGLHQRVLLLASRLRASGISPQARLVVLLPRSLDAASALLAALALDAVFVPLDPALPPARLALLLSQIEAPLLLTSSALLPLLASLQSDLPPLLTLENLSFPAPFLFSLTPCPHPEQLLALLFTSGSTGIPKAVALPQRQLLQRLHWMWGSHPFVPGERLAHKTTLTFIDALWELLGGLLQGVPTVIIEQELLLNPSLLIQHLQATQVSRLWLVPSLLHLLLETIPDLEERLPDLERWVSSGEALSPSLISRFERALPTRRLLNLYGTTEVFDATLQEPACAPAIGRPIDNVQVYLLDAWGGLAPIGVQGELAVGGAGLAHGYLGQPERTAQRFVPHPWSSEPGARLYLTGDRARWRADGQLEYLGRADTQVKRRGHRIELGEIEAQLQEHPAVKQAAVVRWPGEQERLLAYVQPREPVEQRDVLAFLQKRLPNWMLPDRVLVLDEVPLTATGKLDRRHLPAPQAAEDEEAIQGQAPQTPTEERIAQIWGEVLKRERIGTHESFFALGGHSLLAVQVVTRLHSVFQVNISVRDLFEAPTIAEQAALVTQLILAEIENLSEDEVRQLN